MQWGPPPQDSGGYSKGNLRHLLDGSGVCLQSRKIVGGSGKEDMANQGNVNGSRRDR